MLTVHVPISAQQREQVSIGLEIVAAYGWAELSDSSRPMSELERTFAGAVLSHVGGIAEGPDSALYVVDRDFQKIVVFNYDASFRGLLVGGYGRGPGEFVRMRSISVSDNGQIAVLDGGLNRITVFDDQGRYRNSFVVTKGQPMSILYRDAEIWVALWQRFREPVVQVYDSEGHHLRSHVTASDRDRHFADFGELGTLTLGQRDGEVIYLSASPGVWTTIKGDIETKHGTELFPFVNGRSVTNQVGGVTLRIDVGTRGLQMFDDLGLGLIYLEWLSDSEASPDHRADLKLFFPDLRPEPQTINLTAALGWTGYFKPSAFGPEFYVARFEPTPHIIRVRVVAR
jgi:hypothetical protein